MSAFGSSPNLSHEFSLMEKLFSFFQRAHLSAHAAPLNMPQQQTGPIQSGNHIQSKVDQQQPRQMLGWNYPPNVVHSFLAELFAAKLSLAIDFLSSWKEET
jgi:hypothetical protein